MAPGGQFLMRCALLAGGFLFGAGGDEIEAVLVAELLAGEVDDFLDVAAKVRDGIEQGGDDIGVEALDAAVLH